MDNESIMPESPTPEGSLRALWKRLKYRSVYECGTLRYSYVGITMLFFWLVFGALCFSLMQLLSPQLLPIALKNLSGSSQLIGLLCVSIPGLINAIVTPIVSYRSDRTRTRWGRRIPYMLFATPPTVAFLLLIGWAPSLGGVLHRLLPGISETSLGLGILCVAVVGFQFFNMFAGSIFYYIFADVVPEKLMGRFMALFGMTNTAAGYIFMTFFFVYHTSGMVWLYTGFGLLYLVGFSLMSLMVKEGSYPPPVMDEYRKSWTGSVRVFFKESFTIPYYVFFFLGTSLSTASTLCRNLFNFFFANENLGLSSAEYGYIMGVGLLLTFFLKIPLGYAVDRFRPIRVYLFGMILVVLTNIFSIVVFRNMPDIFALLERLAPGMVPDGRIGYVLFFIVTQLLSIVYAIQFVAELPMFAALLPHERYGQFSSAQAMFRAVIVMICGWGGGIFIESMGNDYLNLYVWDVIFTVLSFFCMLYVYHKWKQYGGNRNYTAP